MKILLTRPLEQSRLLKTQLEAKGETVFCLPLIAIKPPKDKGIRLKKALKRLPQYHWLVLTSPNAVRAVARYVGKFPKGLKVAAVGPKTFEALRQLGVRAVKPKKNMGGDALAALFKKSDIRGKNILYPQSSIGRDVLSRALTKMGGRVDVIEAYQTVAISVPPRKLKKIFQNKIDAVLFFSPSAVRSFKKNIRKAGLHLKGMRWVPFGPTTKAALRKEGFTPSPCGGVNSPE